MASGRQMHASAKGTAAIHPTPAAAMPTSQMWVAAAPKPIQPASRTRAAGGAAFSVFSTLVLVADACQALTLRSNSCSKA